MIEFIAEYWIFWLACAALGFACGLLGYWIVSSLDA